MHGHLLLVSTSLKVLLFPSYRSTDFEVHRNWLAVTHSLPLHEWYFDATSPWTLDYPPFFAYFEWLLSQAGRIVDGRMLEVANLGYASDEMVAFQRGSVIVTELVLYAATCYYLHDVDKPTRRTVLGLVMLNGPLLLVDHIHFQYNGLVLGLLVLCLALAKDARPLACCLVFSVLVLTKHLFLTLAPVFAMYLLVHYCAAQRSRLSVLQFLLRLAALASIALSALLLAFGPIYLSGERSGQAERDGPAQLAQILRRLFPFGRGLLHAYWAPNVWALYYTCDRVYASFSRFTSLLPFPSFSSGAASGIVGEFPPMVLPPISSAVSICAVLASLTPALYALCRRPASPRLLTRCVVYSSLSAFMVGYHVHEKAILVPLVVQALVSHASDKDAFLFLLLAGAALCSLLPLFTALPELLPKTAIAAAYLACAVGASRLRGRDTDKAERETSEARGRAGYRSGLQVTLGVLALLSFCTEVAHPLLVAPRLPFLPLMAVSAATGLVLLYCWGLSFQLLWEAE